MLFYNVSIFFIICLKYPYELEYSLRIEHCLPICISSWSWIGTYDPNHIEGISGCGSTSIILPVSSQTKLWKSCPEFTRVIFILLMMLYIYKLVAFKETA